MLKGVSPFVSTVLIILITITAIILVLTIGMPVVEKAKESGIINEAMQNLHMLDKLIREVASEGIGSLRTMQLRSSGGEYKINQKTNSIDFTLETSSQRFPPGTFIKENNLIISSGASAKAYENQTELILENDIIKFMIQKIGNESSPQTINTSEIIRSITFKNTSTIVYPESSSIIIDNFPNTSYGTGYSELVKSGDHLSKAEAIVHVNSSRIYYEVVYTLQSEADFLIMGIQNAYYK
jgi:type II secretory pathway pseudopilin PulG